MMIVCFQLLRRELADADYVDSFPRQPLDLNNRHPANLRVEIREELNQPRQEKLVRSSTANPDRDGFAIPKFACVQEEVAPVVGLSPTGTDAIPKRITKRSPLVQRLCAYERSDRKKVMLNKDRLPAASERKEQTPAGRRASHYVNLCAFHRRLSSNPGL
jgi:hypothetical protein